MNVRELSREALERIAEAAGEVIAPRSTIVYGIDPAGPYAVYVERDKYLRLEAAVRAARERWTVDRVSLPLPIRLCRDGHAIAYGEDGVAFGRMAALLNADDAEASGGGA